MIFINILLLYKKIKVFEKALIIFMINNYTISQLSLNLLLIAPFVSRSITFQKNLFDSYNKINLIKSSYSFLYSKTNTMTVFKSSSFSKFHGQSPIFMNSMVHFTSYGKNRSLNEDETPSKDYDQILFSETMYFYDDLNTSVSFNDCSFIDCVNEFSQGGAIHFRKVEASLNIASCQFIRCRSFQSSGAIYIIQLYHGYWLIGNVNITNTLFDECYDYNPESNYVAGVIDAYVAMAQNNYGFLLKDSQFVNCQFDKVNKIIEAQVRLNTNIFHIDYNNFTNNNQKIDASAIMFAKYNRGYSTLSFLNAYNQHGFSFFEIYDLESGYIHAYNINMINTTFINFAENTILIKVAFFNIFFAYENCFFLDNFYAIDFITIFTDINESDYELVEPVLIQIPDECVIPNTYNLFSNQKFSDSNQVNYTIIPNMKYNYNSGLIINKPSSEETPTPTMLPLITPMPTDEFSTFDYTTIEIVMPSTANDLFNSINNAHKRLNYNIEIIIASMIGVVVIGATIVIIINVVIQKKRSNQTVFLDKDNEDDTDEYINKSEKEDISESNQNQYNNGRSSNVPNYELFYSPRNQTMQSNLKTESLINSLVKDDPFKNDIEEFTQI